MTLFSKSVVADADDGADLSGTGWESDENNSIGTLVAGDLTTLGASVIHAGLRFTNITIPKSSTINSANITLYNQARIAGSGGDVNVRWYAWATDDAAQFANGGNMPSTVTKTTAFTTFTAAASETPSNIVHSITTVIQEIINRVGWVSGNDINIIAFDNNSSTDRADIFDGFGTSGGTPALLEIDYTAAGGAGKIRLGNVEINKIYLGSSLIKKVYLGTTLVYSKP